jgi:hypothetical protein
LVVPLKTIPPLTYDPKLKFTIDDFNEELAHEIQKGYGIADSDTPCLVFDNFVDEMRQLKVGLTGGEQARKALIVDITEFMNSALPKNQEDYHPTDETRLRMTGELFNYTQAQAIGRQFVTMLPSVGSALAKLLVSKFGAPPTNLPASGL